MRRWLRRWFVYREITQTEARERLKAQQPACAPLPPTWRVYRKSRSIEEWKQRHERKRA